MKVFLGKLAGLLLLCGILFGAFVVAVAPFEMVKKSQAELWPSRNAIITKSYANHKRSSKGGLYWHPEICGTYNDSGESFCVKRVRYGTFRMGEGQASALEDVARYPVGRVVKVYYDPEHPTDTILEARSSWREMTILFGLGIACLLMPVLLWLFRKKLEPERQAVLKLSK